MAGYGDVISEEEFVKEFNDAADDMGEVIMNTADDDFAVSKAAGRLYNKNPIFWR